jgi:hypothetical protein
MNILNTRCQLNCGYILKIGLFHDFDVIGLFSMILTVYDLLFHDFDVIDSVNHFISVPWILLMNLFKPTHLSECFVKVHYFQVDYCIKTSKEKCVFMLQNYLSAFSIFSNVREVNLVYPIHMNLFKPTHLSDSLV